MNKYLVKGKVSWIETKECSCCGQVSDRDRETMIPLEIEAVDEDAARSMSLVKAIEFLAARYPLSGVSDVGWTYQEIVLVRQVTEAELMRRAGAPTLF